MNVLRVARQSVLSKVAFVRVGGVVTLTSLMLLPLSLNAAAPTWWTDRGVVDIGLTANDYAAVNQGQVKNMAKQAMQELDEHLPGGAGDAVHTMVDAWGTPTAMTNDFTAVNLGQLKHLAQSFYDRLILAGYTDGYPWTGSVAQANDFAAANIGQVKNLFSFDLTYDGDPNGLPDWWEKHWFKQTGVDPTTAVTWDPSLTLLQAFQQGLNPKDYYNSHPPTLAITGGDGQQGPPGGFVPLPLLVSASDGNGNPLINAPVKFTVKSGGGNVQKSSVSSPNTTIAVLTDYRGQAKVFFQLPNVPNNTSTITAMPGGGAYSAALTFTETSDGGTGSYGSPFAPSNIVAIANNDGSMDVSWVNNTDDPSDIPVSYKQPDGTWSTPILVPAGTTSVHIP